jgi:16S rRNA (uracil1498-N3)-methyltransferase
MSAEPAERAPRFVLEGLDAGARTVTFDGEQTRHLSRVLRLGAGDLVVVVDGRGREWSVRLTEVTARAAAGLVLAERTGDGESPLHLTLAQGVPKSDKMDLIVRMVTELGAAAVRPLVFERTVTRAANDRWRTRHERWQRIAREAAKQCGRAVVPPVSPPVTLPAWLEEPDDRGLMVCLWEGEPAPLADRLPPGPVRRATLVVGPEGGLAEGEVARLAGAGAVLAGLGPRILRTETAGPVGIALLQARYGDLGAAS